LPATTRFGSTKRTERESKPWAIRKAECVELGKPTTRHTRSPERTTIRASRAALPGSVHDLTAARTHGIIDTLSGGDVMGFADKAYQGARGGVRTPTLSPR
jgi:hypothetical protein